LGDKKLIGDKKSPPHLRRTAKRNYQDTINRYEL
jgi:hypothetical protein